jgi:hypothetical protein
MPRSTLRWVRSPATRQKSPPAAQSTARIGVTQSTRTNTVARNRLGRVMESAAAVTTGAATLSRSHERRTLSAATPTVIAMTTTMGSNPPRTETTT